MLGNFDKAFKSMPAGCSMNANKSVVIADSLQYCYLNSFVSEDTCLCLQKHYWSLFVLAKVFKSSHGSM